MFARVAEFFRRFWFILSAVIGICTAATAVNVKIHNAAQAAISATVEASVRKAVTEAVADKLAVANSRLDAHDKEVATLRQKDESLQTQLTWLATSGTKR